MHARLRVNGMNVRAHRGHRHHQHVADLPRTLVASEQAQHLGFALGQAELGRQGRAALVAGALVAATRILVGQKAPNRLGVLLRVHVEGDEHKQDEHRRADDGEGRGIQHHVLVHRAADEVAKQKADRPNEEGASEHLGGRGVNDPADHRAGHGKQRVEAVEGAGLHDEGRQKLAAVGKRTEERRHADDGEHETIKAVPNERDVHAAAVAQRDGEQGERHHGADEERRHPRHHPQRQRQGDDVEEAEHHAVDADDNEESRAQRHRAVGPGGFARAGGIVDAGRRARTSVPFRPCRLPAIGCGADGSEDDGSVAFAEARTGNHGPRQTESRRRHEGQVQQLEDHRGDRGLQHAEESLHH